MSTAKKFCQTPFRRMSVDGSGISGEALHPKAAEAIAVMRGALRNIDGIVGSSEELSRDLMRVVELCWGEGGVTAVIRAGALKGAEPEPKPPGEVKAADPDMAFMSTIRRTQGDNAAALELLQRSGRATQAEVSRMSLEAPSKQETFIASRHGVPAGAMGADLSEPGEAAKLAHWALTGKR